MKNEEVSNTRYFLLKILFSAFTQIGLKVLLDSALIAA